MVDIVALIDPKMEELEAPCGHKFLWYQHDLRATHRWACDYCRRIEDLQVKIEKKKADVLRVQLESSYTQQAEERIKKLQADLDALST